MGLSLLVGPSRVFCSRNFIIEDCKNQLASQRSSSLIHTSTDTHIDWLFRNYWLHAGLAFVLPNIEDKVKNDSLHLCSHALLYFHFQSVDLPFIIFLSQSFFHNLSFTIFFPQCFFHYLSFTIFFSQP